MTLEYENLQSIFIYMQKSSEGIQIYSTFRQLASNNRSLLCPHELEGSSIVFLQSQFNGCHVARQTSVCLFSLSFSHQNGYHVEKYWQFQLPIPVKTAMHSIQITVVVGKASHELQIVSACIALLKVSEIKHIIWNKNFNKLYF